MTQPPQSPHRPSSRGPDPAEPDAVDSAEPDPGDAVEAEPTRRNRRAGVSAGVVEDDPARAYDSCLRLLADRARSRAELMDRLVRRGYSEGTANSVLARLERENLIDDADFAEQWVHFRHRDGGKAKRALAQELRHKGVADEVAAAALEQISGEDEAERAAELVRRKLSRKTIDPAIDPALREREMRRLIGMLARKGYSPGLAYRTVKDAWAEAADEAH